MKLTPQQMQRVRYLFGRNQELKKEEYEIQSELAALCGISIDGPTPQHEYATHVSFDEFLTICNIEH